MTGITLEIMMDAERRWDEGGNKTVPTIIAEAILAERERCAAKIEGMFDADGFPLPNADRIAASIRADSTTEDFSVPTEGK